jgi:hypothetical protein
MVWLTGACAGLLCVCPLQEPIPTSLLKLPTEHQSRAVKLFMCVLKYCGDTGEAPTIAQAVDTAQRILHQGLKRAELKDELYMQLVKQTRSNPYAASRLKAWELFNLVASAMPPSKVSYGWWVCGGCAACHCASRNGQNCIPFLSWPALVCMVMLEHMHSRTR